MIHANDLDDLCYNHHYVYVNNDASIYINSNSMICYTYLYILLCSLLSSLVNIWISKYDKLHVWYHWKGLWKCLYDIFTPITIVKNKIRDQQWFQRIELDRERRNNTNFTCMTSSLNRWIRSSHGIPKLGVQGTWSCYCYKNIIDNWNNKVNEYSNAFKRPNK